MIEPLTTLLDRLEPDRPAADGGGFHATIPDGWGQGRAVFGGAVSGLALRALQADVPADRPLRSVHVAFLGPVAPGPVHVSTQIQRSGRAMTLAHAAVEQEGRLCASVQTAWGRARPTRLPVPPPPAPADGVLPDGMAMPYLEGVVPQFTRGFDYRWRTDCLPFSGADEPVIEGAVRLRGAAVLDVAGILALIDSWPAPILPLAQGPVPASTVTWTVHLVAERPEGGWPGDAWYRFSGRTAASAGGYADIHGQLWGPDGQLVATSHQLVAEFSGRG